MASERAEKWFIERLKARTRSLLRPMPEAFDVGYDAAITAMREPSPCGVAGHLRIEWEGETAGTPVPIPEKKFRGDDRCEYCGSQLGHCPQGVYCSNKGCGYVDGYYVQRNNTVGYCLACERERELREALIDHLCVCEYPYLGAQIFGPVKCERCRKCVDVKLQTLLNPPAGESGR